jgi:hypothetical protein
MDFRYRSAGERTMLSGDCIPVIVEANVDHAYPPDEVRLKGQMMEIFERNLPDDALMAACCCGSTIRGRRN